MKIILIFIFKDKEIEFKGGFSRLFSEDIELIKSISYLKKLIPYLKENYYDSMDDEFLVKLLIILKLWKI